MNRTVSKVREFFILVITTSIFSPNAFAQAQAYYGVEPMPVIMYGPPSLYPSPTTGGILGLVLALIRIFIVPIIVILVFVIGLILLIKKLRARRKDGVN